MTLRSREHTSDLPVTSMIILMIVMMAVMIAMMVMIMAKDGG